jgi:hypothetical protein
MAETANSEFWRAFKPIEQVFRLGAMPEAYIANAAIDDDGHFDVFDYIKLCSEPCEEVGVGADYVDKLFR